MGKIKLIARFAGTVLLIGLFAGCAAPQVRERYFWPPTPDTPRIEWLGAYQSQLDLESSKSMLDLITGGVEPVSLMRPTYIAADGKGKVFVSDQKQQAVMVFDRIAQHVHMLDGEKALGLFELPTGVALDGEGNVYAADSKSRKIYVIDSQENIKAMVDLSKELISIASIAVDKPRKRLIVPDVKGHVVIIYDLVSGSIIRTLGKEGDEAVRFNYPTSVAVDAKGHIWVCDSMNARIVQLSPEGKFISAFGQRGDGLGDFNIIKAVALDSEGHIYVTDGKAHRINIHDEKGEILLVFGGPYSLKGVGAQVTPGGFLLPNGIYIDQNDTIYVVDQLNGRFQVFQYVTERYLKEHPVTDQAPAAKANLPAAPPKNPAGAGNI